MKSLLDAAAGAICTLAALTVVAASPHAQTPLERGAYLVNGLVGCGNCHTTRDQEGQFKPGMELAGGFLLEDKMMTVNAPNITPDRETGIGAWTDAQIVTAIREGRRPDGRVLGPPMPFEMYRDIGDDDMRAIVSYLRSVKPVHHEVPRTVYRMPLPPAWGPAVTGPVAAPPKSDKVAYGAYLAGPLGHCIECHTPMLEGGQRDYANRTGAGGFHIIGPWGEAVTRNITPDRETGIGAWTDAEIKRAITTGVRADGGLLGPPMGFSFYKTIRDDDLDAIVAYLRSLKPVHNPID